MSPGSLSLLCQVDDVIRPCKICGECQKRVPRSIHSINVVPYNLEHILINCNYTKEFWAEVIKWLRSLKVNINNLNNKEIMLGMPNCEDELFVNHVLLIAKQYLYSCRWRKTFPTFKVFTSRLRKIQNLELAIAESKNKLSLHTAKWAKFDS